MANTFLAYGQNDSGGASYPPMSIPASFAAYSQFTDGYKGLTWCKTIFCILLGFFDKSMSTPYSGQLYPTGSAFTTNGQASPLG